MFGNNTIKSKVMQVFKAKLEARQKEYNQKCVEIDEDFDTKVEELHNTKEAEKSMIADQIVDSFLSPLV